MESAVFSALLIPIRLTNRDHRENEESIPFHRAVADAILARDGAAAETRMERLLADARHRLGEDAGREGGTSEAAASDRQGMHGASSRHEPPGDIVPVAASDLSSGNPLRKLGSSVKIDAAQDVQGAMNLALPRAAGTAAASILPARTHCRPLRGAVEAADRRPVPKAWPSVASMRSHARGHASPRRATPEENDR